MARFQVHPVTDDNRLAERQSRLRAVPVHEFINGMTIAALSVWAGETVENSGFSDLQICRRTDLGARRLPLRVGFCFHHVWPPAPQDHIAAVGCRPVSESRVFRPELPACGAIEARGFLLC